MSYTPHCINKHLNVFIFLLAYSILHLLKYLHSLQKKRKRKRLENLSDIIHANTQQF